MRLATFDAGRGPRVGFVSVDETLVPLADVVPDAPEDMLGVIAAGDGLQARMRDVASRAQGGAKIASVRLLAPIPRPRRNVFCVGWNYSEHFAEGKAFRGPNAVQEIPEHPALFSKNPFAIIGHDAAIRHPAPISNELDYEVELAVIIGTEGRDISEDRALDHVFGYTVGNDVSVRDVQRSWHGGQWFKGKNFDTHMPLGPWIVTKDEIPDPQTLRITTRVNGVTKQDSNTKNMVFPVKRIIAEISAGLTLYPGDVIITGTPEGVGMGRKPPKWLIHGDVVEVEIEKIGTLRNHIE
jgi:2-keto-4-pentenoate hydratase/2-oxohepta-3-ene-1,7-dioic acid hydratase in catechol pathway